MKPIRYIINKAQGIKYRILDLGCDDLDDAARNRAMVASGDKSEYWHILEANQYKEEMREIGQIIKIRRR